MKVINEIYWRLFLVLVWHLLVLSKGQSQPLTSHAGYFKAALKAQNPRKATLYALKACELATRQRQFTIASDYYLQISNLFYHQKYYLTGIRHAQRGIAFARKYALDSDTLSFKYYTLLASMYSRLSMNDSAGYWYNQTEQLLQIKKRLPQFIPNYIESHYYNEGMYFMRIGDQQRAREYIQKSVEMAEATGDKRSAGLSYLQLANYYFSTYHYQTAADQYRKALHGFAPESTESCWAYALLGNCFRASGNLAEGLKWLRISQEKYKSIIDENKQKRDTNFEFESRYYLGKCEQLAGLDQPAIRSYQACIATYKQLYGSRGELVAASWSGLAAIALKQKQVDRALEHVQQALLASTVIFSGTNPVQNPNLDDIKAGKALYEALRLKGMIWFQIYKDKSDQKALNQAIQTYYVGMQVAQRIRRSFTQLEATYYFNEKIHPCVTDALEAVFELPNPSQESRQAALVFDLLQLYQVMSLSDVLHEKAIKHETIPAELRQQEQDLRQKLAATETELLTNQVAGNHPKIVAQLRQIRRQLYLFDDKLALNYPRYYSLKYDHQTERIVDLQSRLGIQTAYLSFFLSDRFIYGFFAGREQVKIFRRVITPVFAQSIKDLRAVLEQNPGMFTYEGRSDANRLYDYLIRPVEPYLTTVERLIINRDDLVHNIPFEVLEPQEKPDYYLCKRFALSYSYSAKLTFTKSAVATPLQALGFAPYGEDSVGKEKKTFSPRLLRKSVAEVRESGGTVYQNDKATKAQLLRAIPTANLLHLATHATANNSRPEASVINFYPNTADSLLRSSEIVNLPLDHVRLVILSACEGNKGVLQKAEGVLSLARAFRLAGCPTILTTSWSAHNETTYELIRLFYKHLHRGYPADIALQQARLEFFASPMFQKWGHPYHWANFTLIGSPDVVFSATDSGSTWKLTLVVVAVTGIGLFLLLRHLFAKPIV